WLEKSGYDVSYSTDVDTHENGANLLNHKGFLSVGHDEFWTSQMVTAAQTARDATPPVGLGFFGANMAADQITFSPSSGGSSVADRIINAGSPFAAPQSLVGVQTGAVSGQAEVPYVVHHPEYWVYAGTGFSEGTQVSNLVSTQFDSANVGAT